jgi:hypothetical protein
MYLTSEFWKRKPKLILLVIETQAQFLLISVAPGYLNSEIFSNVLFHTHYITMHGGAVERF